MNALLSTSKIVLAAAVFSVVLGGCDKRSASEPSGASGMGSGGAGNGGAGAGMASPGARGVPGNSEGSSDSPAPPNKPAPAGTSGK